MGTMKLHWGTVIRFMGTIKQAVYMPLGTIFTGFAPSFSPISGVIMGLFDAIARLNATEEQPPTPRAPLLPRPSAGTFTRNQYQPPAKEDVLDTWESSPQELEERRRILNRKRDHLSFLTPCPVCHGRSFVHIEGGGFVCRTCQPSLFGYPVEATGPDRPAPAVDAVLLPAGDREKVLTTPTPTGNKPTETQRSYFAAAWPWIKENRAELLEVGWTMTALVRRAKYRWPVNPWGLAWLPMWTKHSLKITITSGGKIVFQFQASGRDIIQTAWPTSQIYLKK